MNTQENVFTKEYTLPLTRKVMYHPAIWKLVHWILARSASTLSATAQAYFECNKGTVIIDSDAKSILESLTSTEKWIIIVDHPNYNFHDFLAWMKFVWDDILRTMRFYSGRDILPSRTNLFSDYIFRPVDAHTRAQAKEIIHKRKNSESATGYHVFGIHWGVLPSTVLRIIQELPSDARIIIIRPSTTDPVGFLGMGLARLWAKSMPDTTIKVIQVPPSELSWERKKIKKILLKHLGIHPDPKSL